MAARLLCSGECSFVAYSRSLHWLCARGRAFSSHGRNNSNETSPGPEVKEVTREPIHTWLNIKAGIFGPRDQRLPLPGDVGPSQQLGTVTVTTQNKVPPDVLENCTNYEQQIKVLEQFSKNSVDDVAAAMDHPKNILQVDVKECPTLVKKDFLDLFPNRSIPDSPLTVLTLCQKTICDMGAWSEPMQMEREKLTEYFVKAAEDICLVLQSNGFWADFIDPSSGRPYYGPYTNATLFETDERYRHLGFRIEDQGCCRIISHRLWGTHIFVGAIFTNAPTHTEAIDNVIETYTNGFESD